MSFLKVCLLSYILLQCIILLSSLNMGFLSTGILGIVGLLDDFLIVLMGFLHVAALYRSVLYYRHAGT